MNFRRSLYAVTLLVCAPVCGAEATSIRALRPHQPERACAGIENVISIMIGQDQWDDGLLIYTDEFGRVDYDERGAFVRNMTSAQGKLDKRPLLISMVWPVGSRDIRDAEALYVVGLQRNKWHPDREDVFDPMNIEPEGYDLETTYWLAEFSENRVAELREGHHYVDFVNYNTRLNGCGNA